jgi:sulfite reductase beta subunit-like hemoprotein
MSQAGVVTMKAMVQRLNRRLERDSKVLRSPRGDAASSDSLSSAEVASSSRRIGASLRKARAMPMRCRCPGDSFTPRSPTTVATPSGRFSMNINR